ncbi:MAG: hypothetical protein AAFQ15_05960, partial [Pseudomonadota bacterium]
AAPLFSNSVRASSGELNILMWSDYLPAAFKEQFTAETGITINHTPVGSNEEILAAIEATGGTGFDLTGVWFMVMPVSTVNRSLKAEGR